MVSTERTRNLVRADNTLLLLVPDTALEKGFSATANAQKHEELTGPGSEVARS